MTRIIVLLLIFLCTALILPAKPSYAVEDCGFVSGQSRELTERRRFELLADYRGRAFIDMSTCLVWRLDVNEILELSTTPCANVRRWARADHMAKWAGNSPVWQSSPASIPKIGRNNAPSSSNIRSPH